MEKLDLSFELSKEQKKLKQENYEALLKNKHVQAWLQKYEQRESFVYDHTGKFLDWLSQVEKCVGCKGLAFCRQDIKGQYMDLYMDGYLNFGVHRCDYFKDHEQALKHGRFYLDTNMSEEQLRINIDEIDVEQESAPYIKTLGNISALLKNETIEKGLYLWGKPGVGKSYLAAGITNHYAKKHIRCAFVNVPKLIGDLKMLFHENDVMQKKLRTMRDVPVLVLDDIGGESVTAWSRDDILLPLLDDRMEHKKLTFFTSNYNMEELKERIKKTSNNMSEPMAAERLLERISTLACEEFVKGESRRK